MYVGESHRRTVSATKNGSPGPFIGYDQAKYSLVGSSTDIIEERFNFILSLRRHHGIYGRDVL